MFLVIAVGVLFNYFFLFFNQKTAYEMRISDWSSDVCSSDLRIVAEIHYTNTDPAYAGMMRLTFTIEQAKAGSKVALHATGMPQALEVTAHRAALAAALRRLALLTE